MKKILITGASGFVGSHLVEEALQRNLEVYAGVRKSSSRKYLQDERIRFFEMNFSDRKALTQQLEKDRFDYVIHNAGVVTASKIEEYRRVNFDFTRNFVDSLVETGNTPEKFTLISSLAAYGPASSEDLSDFLKEEDDPKPINAYGKAKLEAERFLVQLPDFPYLIIRPTAIYGPREREILTFFKLINWYLEGYIGRKRQHLTFIYVKDLVRAVLDATTSQHVRKAYFISDGKYYAQWELGKYSKKYLTKKTLRVDVPISLVRLIAWFAEQTGKLTGNYPPLNMEKFHILSSLNWKCDIQPLKDDLNFQPRYDLEKGIEETIIWYKKEGWL